jgi:hypothetical protein
LGKLIDLILSLFLLLPNRLVNVGELSKSHVQAFDIGVKPVNIQTMLYFFEGHRLKLVFQLVQFFLLSFGPRLERFVVGIQVVVVVQQHL